MRSPAPEPVFSYLRSSVSGALFGQPVLREPEIAALPFAGPHVPMTDRFQPVPSAEPVMAGVWPRVADIPFEPIFSTAVVVLPEANALAAASPLPTPHTSQTAESPFAQPVESWLSASHLTLPLPALTSDRPLPRIAACAPALGAALELAGPVAKPAPEAVESLLPVATAGQLKPATVVRLQPFAVAASEGRTVPGFDAPRLAPPAHQPASATVKQEVQPICAVHVAIPQAPVRSLTPNLPQPGMRPLEFHTNHGRGQAVSRLEWRGVRFAPLAPDFLLRTVWDRSEDQIAVQPAAKKSNIAEVFTLPEARQKSNRWIGYAAKIAAGILVVVATWYGAGKLKMERSISVRAGAGAPASNQRISPAGAGTTVAAAVKPKSKGALNWMREGIATRAAVQYTDNLRDGMEAWGAAAKSYPAGWARNADGYVQTGALALFSPTRTLTDYRLEFFGQIENKGIGWTVRAKDENNYHAMKFTVIEAGLRPIIAMVHYNVIDGKAGKKMQIPLNVMVHNRQPIQVAVNLKGTRFVTSIDGEEVDSFSDDSLRAGGVGFFSEAGEKARLYWVKVSKNDDWLGHVCAFLSGVNGSSDTAELWPRELPASPWNPDGGPASLAGAWIASPYIRASRRARSKSQRC
jgi:hypothetical protein